MEITYEEVVAYLMQQLPMYQRIGEVAFKKDLENIRALCQVLDHPQWSYPTIHIAGTNGKGSTSHILAALLQQAGLKVGLYTSPHYIDFRERVRINGRWIPKEDVVHFVHRYKSVFENISPSFFEWSVALAFFYFAKQEVDVAIIETGLGGRLDSTNIVRPVLSIITNVDFDHMEFLGHTIDKIAVEKAGIIKQDTPVLLGERNSTYQHVMEHVSKDRASELSFAEDLCRVSLRSEDAATFEYQLDTKEDQLVFTSDVGGKYQGYNLRTAIAAYLLLGKIPFTPLPDLREVLPGLSHIRTATGMVGRWQWCQSAPPIILDGAHNQQALEMVFREFEEIEAEQRIVILGVSRDKDLSTICNILPKNVFYFCCQANVPRAMNVNELSTSLAEAGFLTRSYPSVGDAFRAAKEELTEYDAMLVTGSIFVIGEILSECPMQNTSEL